MGFDELKNLWEGSGLWHSGPADRTKEREAALPRLLEILNRLLTGGTASTFKREWTRLATNKVRRRVFHGLAGQMFLNTVVNTGAEEEVGAALRAALSAPRDEDEAKARVGEFLAAVDDARDRAREMGVAVPSLGYAVLRELLLGSTRPRQVG
jgi:hypothetical protein